MRCNKRREIRRQQSEIQLERQLWHITRQIGRGKSTRPEKERKQAKGHARHRRKKENSSLFPRERNKQTNTFFPSKERK